MPSPDLTSMQLRRAIDGDLDALDQLVARLTPVLVAQAAFRMGPVLRRHHDPQDLVHDAWLVALPRLRGLPPRDGRHTPVLLRFLSTTVLHRVRNLARKHILESPAGPGDREAPEDLEQISSEQSGVVTKAVRAERADEVRAQLERLDEADREIVLLRGVEQQSNKMVGLLLGIEPKAVSKRYHRLLEKLRDRLPDSVFGELNDEDGADGDGADGGGSAD